MNLVDSCGWLAYFADETNAGHFAEPLATPAELLVPTVVQYEVFKVLLREAGEDQALAALAAMSQGQVVAIDSSLAVAGARLSLQHALPMADSLILALARTAEATLWTQDAHFAKVPGVRFFPAR